MTILGEIKFSVKEEKKIYLIGRQQDSYFLMETQF